MVGAGNHIKGNRVRSMWWAIVHLSSWWEPVCINMRITLSSHCVMGFTSIEVLQVCCRCSQAGEVS